MVTTRPAFIEIDGHFEAYEPRNRRHANEMRRQAAASLRAWPSSYETVAPAGSLASIGQAVEALPSSLSLVRQ